MSKKRLTIEEEIERFKSIKNYNLISEQEEQDDENYDEPKYKEYLDHKSFFVDSYTQSLKTEGDKFKVVKQNMMASLAQQLKEKKSELLDYTQIEISKMLRDYFMNNKLWFFDLGDFDDDHFLGDGGQIVRMAFDGDDDIKPY